MYHLLAGYIFLKDSKMASEEQLREASALASPSAACLTWCRRDRSSHRLTLNLCRITTESAVLGNVGCLKYGRGVKSMHIKWVRQGTNKRHVRGFH